MHRMRPKDIILISLSELAYVKPLEGQNKHTTSILLKLSPGTSEFAFGSDIDSLCALGKAISSTELHHLDSCCIAPYSANSPILIPTGKDIK